MATALLLHPLTPPDYHRIVSPTLIIPNDPTVSVPVGILACQRDPLLRTLNTVVISATISQPPSPPTGKKVKKSVIAPVLPSGPILEVILQDTIIFPEGGGQPTDTGLISTPSHSTFEVVQCKRHGGHAVHYVRLDSKTSIETALALFQSGTQVTVELDDAGFERRYDHMTMHTSQHLLSALLESRLQVPTLSWSLTAYPSPCYVDLPRSLTATEIVSIQQEANKLVFEGRRVHVEVQELDPVEPESTSSISDGGRAAGRGLPQDYTGGVNRIVIIDGVDKNPCCGTHLPSLHNLQLFLLPPSDVAARTSSSIRLYFVAGPRLINHLTTTHTLLMNTSMTLTCGAPQVPERVAQVVAERKRAEKRVEDLESELAKVVARELKSEMTTFEGFFFAKHLHRIDDASNSLTFLNTVSSTFCESLDDSPFLIVLSSSPSTQLPTNNNVLLVFGSDVKMVKAVGESLKAKLGVKGGGQGKWSGKFTGAWLDKREGAAVDEVIRNLVL